MVCKNCGADLKPGVKYCLNCGNYIDEADMVEENDNTTETSDENDSSYIEEIPKIEEDIAEEKVKKKRKRKRHKLKLVDIVIYLGLFSIIVVSIIIIIITINKKDDTPSVPQEPTILEDSKVTMSNYSVTIPGNLRYVTESNRLYVSDNNNFTFSFNVTEDDYKKYSTDLSILSKQMEKSGYVVENSEVKTNGTEEFVIYRIKVSSTVKYFYVTTLDDKHTLMGIIEVLESGNWEAALPNITLVKNSIAYVDASSEVNSAIQGIG